MFVVIVGGNVGSNDGLFGVSDGVIHRGEDFLHSDEEAMPLCMYAYVGYVRHIDQKMMANCPKV